MGKIVTYIIYFLIAIAIYVLIKAAYFGEITSDTTIGNASKQITTGSIQTIKEIKDDASSTIEHLTQDIKTIK